MTVCAPQVVPVSPKSPPSHDYEREHRIAESLQRVLLRTSPHGTLPGLALEVFYEAALDEATVGGDSYDAFPLADGKAALIIADASGKGLGAAERVAEVRFALRAFLREHGDPCRALSCLNDFVCDAQRLGMRDDGTFTTLTLVVLDCATGETSCLCAGGEPPLVLRSGGLVETVPICGPALGLSPAQGYAAASLHLGVGDSVLLATDGITEARCRATGGPKGGRVDPLLGLTGLAHLAGEAQRAAAPLRETCRAIFEGARAFGGGTFHDDACLLIARREEAGTRDALRFHVPSPENATGK
jgi:serine phosphatase RsbU (regulator of sigma subunit)